MADRLHLKNELSTVCLRLFEKALNCKFVDNKVEFSLDKVDVESVPLLFALPGVLIVALTSITRDEEFQNNFENIKRILDDESDSKKTITALKNILKTEPIPDELRQELKLLATNAHSKKYKQLFKRLRLYFPSMIEALILLIHPKSIHFEWKNIFGKLVFSFGNYFILASILIKNFIQKEEYNHIELKELYGTVNNFDGFEGELNLFNLSLIFWKFMQEITESDLNNFVKTQDENVTYCHESILIPSTNYYLQTLNRKEDKLPFCIITDHENLAKNYDGDSFLGFSLDTNIFSYLKYDLWQLGIVEGRAPNDSPLEGYYLFVENEKKFSTLVESLINRIYQQTRISVSIISSIINSWDVFIEDAIPLVSSKIDQYYNWFVKEIIENRRTFEQFLRFADLKRVCLSIDVDINNPKMDEARKIFRQAYGVFLPSEEIMIFLNTASELDSYINMVTDYYIESGKEDLLEFYSLEEHYQEKAKEEFEAENNKSLESELLDYFDNNEDKFLYLKLLDRVTLKTINLAITDDNVKRKNYRIIVDDLKNKIGQKKFKKSKYTKLLGLEAGTDKYLRFV